MLIIGELLNSTRTKIRRAIADKNAAYIKEIVKKQEAAGAHYLDVNTGAFAEEELGFMKWIVGVIRDVTELPLSIDSPRAEAIALGCQLAGEAVLVNSISAESERFKAVLPIVKRYNAKVIALAMDDGGLTDDEDKMYSVACHLIENLTKQGVEPDRILLDPLVRPIGTNSIYGKIVLNLLRRITEQFPEVHKVCGLSNVSFGLPGRKIVNRSFILMAMACGLDSVIIDPLDKVMMAQIKAGEALLGKDPYCMNYIGAARRGEFDNIR